ncbi:MAG TPA: NAD-dependent epimerase/dehydratase family protein [Terriglobales bacterium]|nr:NAD-dependent epimerase/dehydratase family protein [Terriglobales bacterium]
MKSVLVTGSSGLIGSECVSYFDRLDWHVHGIDNNMRMSFFGPDGDTSWNLKRLLNTTHNFEHHELDIRERERILGLVRQFRPNLLIHCAAQPSHDLAKDRPFDDFEINATGTLNLLEAARHYCPESPFIFMSTNKVYGDAPNELPLQELETRWDYAQPENYNGISESCRIDATLHSLFGASKAAADLVVQEYGRYFNMPTVCFRGGCLTGPHHSGAELHGFLAYLARCFHEDRTYRIYGYKGKQVRDNIHSRDVCDAFYAFYESPRCAAVYNLGGGRSNSISILEAIGRMGDLLGKTLKTEYVDKNRVGDHICYISDLRRFQSDYPNWRIRVSLEEILHQFMSLRSAATV